MCQGIEIETVTEKEKPRCIETNFIECENGEILTDLWINDWYYIKQQSL